MKNIAIIPARSGSKGLENKNIKLLNGKPLIAYSIDAAIESNMFLDVIVSTDNQYYADIAKQYGANVPFLRDESLAGDNISTNIVIQDVLERVKDKKYENFMILQPTSPLRRAEDIIKALNMFAEKKANSVISVCETEHSPLYTGIIPESLSIDGFLEKDIKFRRQDLPKYHRLNGAIYLSKIDYFLRYKNLYKKKSYAYIMDKKRSIDIDDELDFLIAETILRNQ